MRSATAFRSGTPTSTEAGGGGGGMQLLQGLALAQVHVDTAREARVETSHRSHDVDALEVVEVVLLEDRGVHHRVLVGSGGAVDVARAGVPRCRRVRVVVGDLAPLEKKNG